MQLRCTYCQTMFALSHEEMLAGLEHMEEEKLKYYDAHCPKCRRANRVDRFKMEMAYPNWKADLKAMAKQAVEPKVEKPAPAPAARKPAPAAKKAPSSSTKKGPTAVQKTPSPNQAKVKKTPSPNTAKVQKTPSPNTSKVQPAVKKTPSPNAKKK